jgi:hypothetical protein
LLESIELEAVDATDAFLSSLATHCGNLQRARISNCLGIRNAVVNALIQGCPRLTHITIEDCDRVDGATLRLIAAAFPRFKPLAIN